MTEKVKLTRNQAEAIEKWLESWGGDKADLLETHAKIKNERLGWLKGRPYKSFNDLSQMDMARALLIGYEVEESLEIGDWAVFEHYGDTWVAKVKDKHNGSSNINLFLPDEDIHVCTRDRYYPATPATPEEIKSEKERRIWAKIDRKPGEFRGGDYGDHINGNEASYNAWYLKQWYEEGKLKGFYPVESFIEFGGGESHDS